MSYNGSGTFSINSAGQPVITGTVISSTAFNALTADLATGLSTAITKDGQTTTTARIVFAQGVSSTLVTDATSATTGSIISAGGISMQKALWVGTTSRHVGATQFDAAITYGGVTLSNAVTGTGNMVLSASPTLTGTLTAAAANFSGNVSSATEFRLAQTYLRVATLGDAGGWTFGGGYNFAFNSGVGWKHDSTGALSGVAYTNTGSIGFFAAGSAVAGTAAAQVATFASNLLTLSQPLNYGGVTLSNSVTGTGSMVLSASPTFTGTVTPPGTGKLSSNLNVFGATTVPVNGTDVLAVSGVGTTRLQAWSIGGQYSVLNLGSGASGTATQFYALTDGTSNNVYLYTATNTPLLFGTNNTERARIGSDGSFLVGGTTNVGAGNVCITGGSGPALLINKTTTGLTTNGYLWNPSGGAEHVIASGGNGIQVNYNGVSGTPYWAQFTYNNGSAVGSITFNSVNTAYNTSSDARLKTNVSDAAPASALIDAIQVRQFDWKVDNSHQRYGMVAQELLEVAPEAVSVPTDPEEMMGVDYSKLVPMLIKAVQELTTRLAALENK